MRKTNIPTDKTSEYCPSACHQKLPEPLTSQVLRPKKRTRTFFIPFRWSTANARLVIATFSVRKAPITNVLHAVVIVKKILFYFWGLRLWRKIFCTWPFCYFYELKQSAIHSAISFSELVIFLHFHPQCFNLFSSSSNCCFAHLCKKIR